MTKFYKRGKNSKFELRKITGKDLKNIRKKSDNRKILFGLVLCWWWWWVFYLKKGKMIRMAKFDLESKNQKRKPFGNLKIFICYNHWCSNFPIIYKLNRGKAVLP